MKAGQFNIDDYLEKLYEESTQMMDGGEGLSNQEGIVIPDTNVKSYNWLKKEFQKGKVEVKVEMKMGGAEFEPGYDLQTDLKSVKDFKPGMFGEIKTADTKGEKKPVNTLDAKKASPDFKKGEGDKDETSKSKDEVGDIKNKEHVKHEAGESEEKEEKEEHEAGESKEKEKKEEHEAGESKEKEEKGGEAKVKKLDLKTKKK